MKPRLRVHNLFLSYLLRYTIALFKLVEFVTNRQNSVKWKKYSHRHTRPRVLKHLVFRWGFCHLVHRDTPTVEYEGRTRVELEINYVNLLPWAAIAIRFDFATLVSSVRFQLHP